MSPEEQLAGWLQGAVAVVGIGNLLRGDDAAGSIAARRIRPCSGVSVIDAQETPEDCLAGLVDQRPDTIVLLDSMEMNSEPGSIALLNREQIAGYWPSTHRAPLGLLMGILERETNARVFAIGIQPAQTGFLTPMSDAVAAGVAQIADMMNRVLAARAATPSSGAAGSLGGALCR